MDIMFLQLQYNGASTSIGRDMAILFDTPLERSVDIAYDSTTGHISFTKLGVYSIQWGASMVSGGGMDSSLKVVTDDGKEIVGRCDIKDGQVVGFAIINVTEIPQGFYLKANDFSMALEGKKGGVNLTVFGVNLDMPKSTDKTLSIPFTSGFGSTVLPSIRNDGVLTQIGIIANGITDQFPAFYPLSNEKDFTIPFSVVQPQYMYSFPYSVQLVAANCIYNNYTSIAFVQPTTNISPYVGIAIQKSDDAYDFEIVEESRVYPENGYSNTITPPSSLKASRTDLNIEIPANTMFAIVGGFISLGDTCESHTSNLFYHGSMIFEIIND